VDRFTAGLLSGFAGGIIMNVWEFISYHPLQFSQHRYVDWSGVMLFGSLPDTASQVVVALIMQLIFASFMGGLFSLILPLVGSGNHLIKGVVFAIIMTFVFYVIPTLYREPIFTYTPVESVISNNIGAIIWGLTTAALLKRINISAGLSR
jgi:hypothetical protein